MTRTRMTKTAEQVRRRLYALRPQLRRAARAELRHSNFRLRIAEGGKALQRLQVYSSNDNWAETDGEQIWLTPGLGGARRLRMVMLHEALHCVFFFLNGTPFSAYREHRIMERLKRDWRVDVYV
jgi:hypothetical protein